MFFTAILLIIVMVRNKRTLQIENFITETKFIYKTNEEIYDDFYTSIYDSLVFNSVKTYYEIGEIINSTSPTEESIILDVGSGTGHHVDLLNKKGYKTIGVDNSMAMVEKAKQNYPNSTFVFGDVTNSSAFIPESFTHILCLYFTIYYFRDKSLFFRNCYTWLKPGGYLVVHIVNRDMFDPILPPSNPLLLLSPQRYAEERITKSSVTFNNFKYDANFDFSNSDNTASFVERFKDVHSDKTFRKQEHVLYMDSEEDIKTIAKSIGFIILGKIDLLRVSYEYQYLYIFQKVE
jgi:SAM-dependent methyltransferase